MRWPTTTLSSGTAFRSMSAPRLSGSSARSSTRSRIRRRMNPDFLDLLTALSVADARFLVVGGYAVGVHGRPRATKDLDVWIEASVDNARKVMQALREFGAPIGDLAERDLEMPGTGFKMGEPPARIDILTRI